MSKKLRILIVDDSRFYRMVLRSVLADNQLVEVVGEAENGAVALQRIAELQPDLLTLDLEMPEMNGLELLRELSRRRMATGAIMFSTHTRAGAEKTTEALRCGAFDFVLKPDASSQQQNRIRLETELLPKINAYAENRFAESVGQPPPNRPRKPQAVGRPDIVAIGASTGGPAALHKLLEKLPRDFSTPIIVVQHMPAMFTRTLARDLDKSCALNVSEAVHSQPLQPGHIWIAPGGNQVAVERREGNVQLRVTDDPPQRGIRPSIDYLLMSVADVYGSHSLAVILTGMGNDGTRGCELIRAAGGTIVAQDRGSSVIYGMPRCVAEAGLADEIGDIDEIRDFLLQRAAIGGVPCG